MYISLNSRALSNFKVLSLNCVVVGLFLLIGNISAKSLRSSAIMFPDDRDEEATPVPKLCPNSTWYHNQTGTCHPSKKQGPCPPLMKFYAIDKRYGECDCDKDSPTSTAWVYDLASDRCFKSYQQAYCKSGEWLIFSNSTGEPVCVPNKCAALQGESAKGNMENPVILFNDQCVRLGEPNSSCASPFEIIIISLSSGKPTCSSEFSDRDLNPTGFRCRPGTKRDRLGKCRAVNNKTEPVRTLYKTWPSPNNGNFPSSTS